MGFPSSTGVTHDAIHDTITILGASAKLASNAGGTGA